MRSIREFGAWRLTDAGISCAERDVEIPPSALKNWDVAARTRKALWDHISVEEQDYDEYLSMIDAIDFAVYRFEPDPSVVARAWQPKWCSEAKPPVREKRKKSNQQIRPRHRFIVFRRGKYRCQICGRKATDTENLVLSIELKDLRCDHVIPKSKGGPFCLDNYQTLCHECNAGKGDLDMWEGD